MDAKITKRSPSSYPIEIEIPYEYSSMLEAEAVIQHASSHPRACATCDARVYKYKAPFVGQIQLLAFVVATSL